jgi:hypothetical protein
MSSLPEAATWERLAEFLGYTLVKVGRDDGSPAWIGTMCRPDGSLARFKLDERDMRRLVEALPRGERPRA